MTANVEGMIQAAIEAYRGGKKAEARTLLEKALEHEEYNEKAWLWLSAVVDNEEEQKTCLENVLIINPDNDRARSGLKSLGVDVDALNADPEEPQEDVAVKDDAAFSGGSVFEDVDFSIPTSSASAQQQADAFQPGELDDWVDNLNLTGETAPPEPAHHPDFPDDMFGSALDFDEDDYASDAPRDVPPTEDPFAVTATDPLQDDFLAEFESGHSATRPELDDDPYAESSAALGSSALDFEDDEDDAYRLDASAVDTEDFDAILSEGINQADDAALFADDPLAEDDEDGQPDPFTFLPQEIKATRLPGTIEPNSMPLLALTGLLVLANIGALVFMAITVLS